MTVTKDHVLHVSDLAKLHLSPEEAELYTSQLSDILGHMKKLAEADTTGVEATATVQDLMNILRRDLVKQSMPINSVLRNAPNKQAGMFKVPKMLDEGGLV